MTRKLKSCSVTAVMVLAIAILTAMFRYTRPVEEVDTSHGWAPGKVSRPIDQRQITDGPAKPTSVADDSLRKD